jgi:hypothetical protein
MKKVSVICIDCDDSYIDRTLAAQTYQNLEVVKTATGVDFYEDIAGYCAGTDSDYICFLEPGQLLAPNKIECMVEYADKFVDAAVTFCYRGYVEADGVHVAPPDAFYRGSFEDTCFHGSQTLRVCIETGNNLLGNLTAMMFRREGVQLCLNNLRQYDVEGNPQMQKTMLLFEIVAERVICLLEKTLTVTFVYPGGGYAKKRELEEQTALFESQAEIFRRVHHWQPFAKRPLGIAKEHQFLLDGLNDVQDRHLKKEITFFATDKGEEYNLNPILEEAKRRGYEVRMTSNLDEKAEIGVYCQHVGKPQNAKFSVILLHDMAQGHLRWPNMWSVERWNAYDIGILPGVRWKERWERCAFQYYLNPRCGAYMFGYPKSSRIFAKDLQERVEELKKSLNLKYDITVLYAPSWENDEKEDDFVRALASLPVNLLVKQAWYSEESLKMEKLFYDTVQDMKKMRELHEGKYDNLHYIEPEENIMVALKICDLVVSDESSVMIEGMMFGKPSIAVEDWLVPDTIPKRFASIPYDDVYKCKKANLRESVEKLIASGLGGEKFAKKSEEFFVNKEHVNRDILDAIEYFTTGEGNTEFMKWKMSPLYMPANLWS